MNTFFYCYCRIFFSTHIWVRCKFFLFFLHLKSEVMMMMQQSQSTHIFFKECVLLLLFKKWFKLWEKKLKKINFSWNQKSCSVFKINSLSPVFFSPLAMMVTKCYDWQKKTLQFDFHSYKNESEKNNKEFLFLFFRTHHKFIEKYPQNVLLPFFLVFIILDE